MPSNLDIKPVVNAIYDELANSATPSNLDIRPGLNVVLDVIAANSGVPTVTIQTGGVNVTPYRNKLNFIGATIADDVINNRTNITIPSVTGFVPYTGATANLNLGVHDLLAPNIQATTSAGLNLKTSSGSTVLNVGAGGGVNATFSGNVSLNTTNKIINSAEPTSAQDVATKNYTDTGLALKAPLASPTFVTPVLGVASATTLGVGIVSPSDILHIKGGNVTGIRAESTGACTVLDMYNGGARTWALKTNFNTSGFELLRSTSPGITAGTTVLHSDDSGNIKIGGTGATEKLEVVGNVKANQIVTALQSLTPSGTTQTIDWNSGSIINLNLGSATGTVALTLSNPKTATSYLIKVTQGATPRNLTFPTGTTQAGGGGVTYTGVANQKDIIAVLYDGTNYFISVSYNYS